MKTPNREQELEETIELCNQIKNSVTSSLWKDSVDYEILITARAELKGFKQGQLSERKKNIKKIKKFEFNYYDCEIGTGFDDWVKREKERIIEQIQGGKE